MLDRTYQPSEQEPRIRQKWLGSGAFHADPVRVNSGAGKPYSIVIPPPNVTAALHLGHALNNTLQDVLTRAHRMMGFEALWMPGTDHAGIATQTVVDKRLKAEDKPALADYKKMEAAGEDGRNEFIALVQAWKDDYEKVITDQLKAMGCSCDWDRQRFTMDEVCARAVREAFFRLFRDGLIYRGKRLVNWDPASRTALSDDEVEMREIDGNFYYLRYPLVHKNGAADGQPVTWSELRARGYPGAGAHPDDERAWVTVATTRPETYLGDTAVAINPKDPRAGALTGGRGLFVELPLVGRFIPIIEDDFVVMPDPESSDVKAKYATGFLKVTPAHDPNDYEIGQRHNLDKINVMAEDASISDKHGWTDIGDAHIFVGLSREEARKKVVMEFKARGLVEEVKPYRHSVGHSYRSHVPIEPYLSDQWYVKVTDDRLRGFAQRALATDQRTTETHKPQKTVEGDGGLRFYPARYAKTYENWHDNLRDWCISRQLWWGHRIPVWSKTCDKRESQQAFHVLDQIVTLLPETFEGKDDTAALRFVDAETGEQFFPKEIEFNHGFNCATTISVALIDEREGLSLERFGFTRDPDVLDTWFSSALWPLSTMGWPEGGAGAFDGLLDAFNPTNVLCTAREIITLWVSRMVMFQRYLTSPDGGKTPGPLPFRDVFIHAMIQDGEGRKMSKSLGNGVDPLDIIATHGSDAMRFTLCNMTTQTQDVRMPVERDEKSGKNTSPKFDLGRNFVTKLWNASKFAMMKLEDGKAAWEASKSKRGGGGVTFAELTLPDVWILSRCAQTVEKVNEALRNYEFSVYAQAMYDLLWRDYCDWYLEAVKPTVAGPGGVGQQSVLRAVLDCILRLLHPIMPYVTEAIWEEFRAVERAPIRGMELPNAELLVRAPWPVISPDLRNERAEAVMARAQALVDQIRQTRERAGVDRRKQLALHIPTSIGRDLEPAYGLMQTLAGLEAISTAPIPAPPDGAIRLAFEGHELGLFGMGDAVDTGKEIDILREVLTRLDKEIVILEGRLGNPGYTDRAPAHLVQQSRDQMTTKISERDAARARLNELTGGGT